MNYVVFFLYIISLLPVMETMGIGFHGGCFQCYFFLMLLEVTTGIGSHCLYKLESIVYL